MYVLSKKKEERKNDFLQKEMKELLNVVKTTDCKDIDERDGRRLDLSSIVLISGTIPLLDKLNDGKDQDTRENMLLRFIAYLMVDVYFKELSLVDEKRIQEIHTKLGTQYSLVIAAKLNYLSSDKKV